MSIEQDKHNTRNSTARIEALSDGIFAIAMTLLVLDLKIPDIVGTATNQGLWQALNQLGPNIFAFVLAFLLLGSSWAVHHRQFAMIERWDDRLVMINTLRLLTVACIPFTTSLIAHYGNLTAGALPFAVNFMLIALTSFWQWDYAVRHKLIGDISRATIDLGRKKGLFAAGVAGVAAIVSLFAPAWSPMVFLLNFLGPAVFRERN